MYMRADKTEEKKQVVHESSFSLDNVPDKQTLISFLRSKFPVEIPPRCKRTRDETEIISVCYLLEGACIGGASGITHYVLSIAISLILFLH